MLNDGVDPRVEVGVVREVGVKQGERRVCGTFDGDFTRVFVRAEAFSAEEVVCPGLHPFEERLPDLGIPLGLELVEIGIQPGKVFGDEPDIGVEASRVSIRKGLNSPSILIGEQDGLDLARYFIALRFNQCLQRLLKLSLNVYCFQVYACSVCGDVDVR